MKFIYFLVNVVLVAKSFFDMLCIGTCYCEISNSKKWSNLFTHDPYSLMLGRILQTFLYFSVLCYSQDHSHSYCHNDPVSLKHDNYSNA